MASDSLGTMTVGVTANVSDAERALNSLASMLEKFDRQQQSRSRGASKAGGSGDGYFSPMSSEFQDEIKRIEALQKRTDAALRFREIRESEMSASQSRSASRGIETNMAGLADEFRKRQQQEIDALQSSAEKQERLERRRIDALQVYAERQERIDQQRIQRVKDRQQREIDNLQVYAERMEKKEADIRAESMKLTKENSGVFGDMWGTKPKATGQAGQEADELTKSANRARFAVLNLGYGVQDFAQVIGTGGFPAAVRASANNLTGLAALFDKTAYASGGLKAALMTPEIGIIAVATAALLAADAWDKYEKSLKRAAEENAKAKFAKFDVAEVGRLAGRQGAFREELALAKDMAAAQKIMEDKQRQDRIEADKEAALAAQAALNRAALDEAKAMLKKRKQLTDEAARAPLTGGEDMGGGGWGGPLLSREDQLLLDTDISQLEANVAEAAAKVKESEEAINKVVGERIDLLREVDAAEKNLRRAKREDVEQRFNKAFADWMRAGQENELELMREEQSDLEYRISFLGRERAKVERSMRIGQQPVGVAQFESATAYEALARSRMGPSPESDVLKRILAAEEKATSALEDIREKLDPGRRERLVILESFE